MSGVGSKLNKVNRMTEHQEGTCKFMMLLGNPCGRSLFDGERCVCHSDKQNRQDGFRAEVVSVLSDPDSQRFDFTGFIFPEGFELRPEYEKPVYFDKAVFLGYVSFLGSEFFGRVSFVEAEFRSHAQFQRAKLRGGGDFTRATFYKSVDFSNAHFGELRDGQPSMAKTQFVRTTFRESADFSDADFDGIVVFLRSTFKGEASFQLADVEGDMSFNNTVFESVAEFDGTVIEREASLTFDGGADAREPEMMFRQEAGFTVFRLNQPKQLGFRMVDLANCRFLETDLSKVEFVDVKWSKVVCWPGSLLDRIRPMTRFMKRRNWCSRLAVGDETLGPDMWPQRTTHPKADHWSDVQYVLIANLYKQLQRNYIADYSYGESGQFYQGEQEMIRKAKGKWRRYFCANNAYRLISLYGESFGLPFLLIAATLLLYPIFLLSNGVVLSPGAPTVNYAFDMSGDFIPLTADYCSAFWKNLTFVTFNRSEIAAHLTEPYQQGMITFESIWIVVLVTFFVRALWRRFRRKSF